MMTYLTDEELIKLWQTNKDYKARDTVLMRHKAAYYKLPGKFIHTAGHISYEDLVQEAAIAFMICADRFNPEDCAGASFFSYAYTSAGFYILNYINANKYVVNLVGKNNHDAEIAVRKAATSAVSEDSIVSESNPTLSEVEKLEVAEVAMNAISLCDKTQRYAMAYMLSDIENKSVVIKTRRLTPAGLSDNWRKSKKRLAVELAPYRSVL